MATGGYFNEWLLYAQALMLGLQPAPNPDRFRLILHNDTLINAASTKAEVLAAELTEVNGYSRYAYSIALDELSLEPENHRAIAPTRDWHITATGGTWQWSGACLLANASDSANAVCTATTATNRVNLTGHNLADGDEVIFTSAGAVFGGLTADQIYYVVNATTDDFQVEATVGGGVVNLIDAGSGSVMLRYANGLLVFGFTYSTPQSLFDGSTDTIEWLQPALFSAIATSGEGWG